MPGALAKGTMRKQPAGSITSSSSSTNNSNNKPLPQKPLPSLPRPSVAASNSNSGSETSAMLSAFPTPPPSLRAVHFHPLHDANAPAATAAALRTVPARKPVLQHADVGRPYQSSGIPMHGYNHTTAAAAAAASAGRAAAAKLASSEPAGNATRRPTATYTPFPATMRTQQQQQQQQQAKKTTDWSKVTNLTPGSTTTATGAPEAATQGRSVYAAARDAQLKASGGGRHGKAEKSSSISSQGSAGSWVSRASASSMRSVRALAGRVAAKVRDGMRKGDDYVEDSRERAIAAWKEKKAADAAAAAAEGDAEKQAIKAMISRPLVAEINGGVWALDAFENAAAAELRRREAVRVRQEADKLAKQRMQPVVVSGGYNPDGSRRDTTLEDFIVYLSKGKKPEPKEEEKPFAVDMTPSLPPLVTKNLAQPPSGNTGTARVKPSPIVKSAGAGGIFSKFLPVRRGTTDSDKSFACVGLTDEELEAHVEDERRKQDIEDRCTHQRGDPLEHQCRHCSQLLANELAQESVLAAPVSLQSDARTTINQQRSYRSSSVYEPRPTLSPRSMYPEMGNPFDTPTNVTVRYRDDGSWRGAWQDHSSVAGRPYHSHHYDAVRPVDQAEDVRSTGFYKFYDDILSPRTSR